MAGKVVRQANLEGLIGRTVRRDGNYYEVLGYTVEHEEDDFVMLYCLHDDRIAEVSLNLNCVRVVK